MKTKNTYEKTSAMATASLVLALLSIFVWWLPFFGILVSFLAVSFAIWAMINMRKDEHLKGKIRSIVAITIGVIFLIISIIMTFGFLVFVKSQAGPDLASVTYQTVDGETLTSDSAFSGLVYLYAEPLTPEEIVAKAITSKGGQVETAVADAGLYLVSVNPGEEAQFLSSLYGESWFLDGSPAFEIVPGAITLYDHFSKSANPQRCLGDHGDLVQLRAGQYGSKTTGIDTRKDISGNNLVNIIKSMDKRMSQAKENSEHMVFSLSLQSHASKVGCVTVGCRTVKREQNLWFQAFFQLMESKFKKNSSIADNTLIVLIAGNAGAELDDEISKLKQMFPNAFERIRIVGSADEKGDVLQGHNYLKDNSESNMVYALGSNVPIFNPKTAQTVECSGTSFAGPEVASLLDRIWSMNPGLSSAQVVAAFNKALNRTGKGSVLPQERGYTTQAFMDTADKIAKGKEIPVTKAEVVPATVTPSGSLDVKKLTVQEEWKGTFEGSYLAIAHCVEGVFTHDFSLKFTYPGDLVDVLGGGERPVDEYGDFLPGKGTFSGEATVRESVLTSKYYPVCALIPESRQNEPVDVYVSDDFLQVSVTVPGGWIRTIEKSEQHYWGSLIFDIQEITPTKITGDWGNGFAGYGERTPSGTFELTKTNG